MKSLFFFLIIFLLVHDTVQSQEQGDFYSKVRASDTLIYWIDHSLVVKKQKGTLIVMGNNFVSKDNISSENLNRVQNIDIQSQTNLDKNVLLDFNDTFYACLRQHIPLSDGSAEYTLFAKNLKTGHWENIYYASWGQHKWSYLQLPYVSDIELPLYDTVIISFSDNTKKKFKLQIINNQYQLIEEK